MSQFKTAKYITVSPASLWFTKQYPEEKWIEFIKDIDEDIRVYFLGSENDSELCNSIINKSGHSNSMNLAGKLSFLESTALMRDAVMNFMNDSAPLHLASAVNAKITAIFCSTVPSFGFGPMSEDSIIVQTKEKLKCKPCGLHGLKDCPEDHFKCAMTIDKNELLKRIE
jgi:heptosyltransferase-2